MNVIEVTNLVKRYGDRVAVDHVSFGVEEGEILAILGPNGAGKTTTVEAISGLRQPDSGTIRVLGLDPRADRDELREQVGVQLQESELPAKLRVVEALDLYAAFYRDPADIDALIEGLGLAEKRDSQFRHLSGGQKQRLSVALALIGNPRIAILDELTTGLDPQARRDTWQLVEDVRARGVTVVLVTHFMDEAERLADRIAIIDQGRLIALDTPSGIVARVSDEQRLRFRPSVPLDDDLLTVLPEVRSIERSGPVVTVAGTGNLLGAVTAVLARHEIVAFDLRIEQSGLDEAFVALTGRSLESDSRSCRMNAVKALTIAETKLFLRDYATWGAAVILPTVILVILGLIFGNKPEAFFGGVGFLDIFSPSLVVLTVATLSVNTMTTRLATYREKGILRRLSTAPVRPSAAAGRRAGHQCRRGDRRRRAVGDRGERRLRGAAAAEPCPGSSSRSGWGRLRCSPSRSCSRRSSRPRRPRPRSDWCVFFAVMFLGGVYLPRYLLPDIINQIGAFTPPGVEGLQDAWLGAPIDMAPLVIMAVITVVAGAIAARTFRWE